MARWVAPAIAGCLTLAFTLAMTSDSWQWPLAFLAAAVAVHAGGRRRSGGSTGEEKVRWPAELAVAGPASRATGSRRQVTVALARVEAKAMLRSASFAVGLAFLGVIVLLYAVIYPDDNGETWALLVGQMPWFAHPVAGMTILAVHRAATRPHRDRTEDLFASCPSEPSERVSALLWTAVVPVVAAVGFMTALLSLLAINSPALHGGLTGRPTGSLLAAPLLAVGATWLGVALGVWARFWLAPVIAVVLVGFVSLQLATKGDPAWNFWSPLSTFGPQVDSPLLLPLAHVWSYLVWMAALSGLVALVAIVRYRRDGWVFLVGCGLVAVAFVAGVAALRPASGDDAQRVADLIARPEANQTCTTASVPVCTFGEYGELRRRVASAVVPVGDALPAGVPAIIVRQAFEGTLRDLPTEVRRSMPGGIPAPGASEVRIGFAGDGDALMAYRLRVAFHALGLPLPPDADPLPKVIAGEARGVVALWLATRGMPAPEARHLVRALSGNDAFERGQAWPQMCGPVVWSPQDLAAARSVLALDPTTVASVVAADWARWSDPRTTTDAFLASLDLPSAGPYDRVVPRRERFC